MDQESSRIAKAMGFQNSRFLDWQAECGRHSGIFPRTLHTSGITAPGYYLNICIQHTSMPAMPICPTLQWFEWYVDMCKYLFEIRREGSSPKNPSYFEVNYRGFTWATWPHAKSRASSRISQGLCMAGWPMPTSSADTVRFCKLCTARVAGARGRSCRLWCQLRDCRHVFVGGDSVLCFIATPIWTRTNDIIYIYIIYRYV